MIVFSEKIHPTYRQKEHQSLLITGRFFLIFIYRTLSSTEYYFDIIAENSFYFEIQTTNHTG